MSKVEDTPRWESRLVLMIFAANSKPLLFWMDRRTVENAPLLKFLKTNRNVKN